MILQIQTGKGKKGRSFRAELLSWIEAPDHFEAGSTDTRNNRPVWMTVAASEQETRAFVTNLRRGKIAEKPKSYSRTAEDRFQLLKTAGYQVHSQKRGGGVVTTLFLPDLFVLNPGMVDPDCIRFIMLPGQQWLDQQVDADEAEALLFLAYLDRRTRFPFPPDATFARSLLNRCLELGLATRGQQKYGGGFNRRQFRYVEHDFDALNLRGGIAFLATHRVFGEVLADEIKKWRSGHA